jgi:hypothetical protein
VVFTLRADFFGALMESDLWAERRGQLSRIEVSPWTGSVARDRLLGIEQGLYECLKPARLADPGVTFCPSRTVAIPDGIWHGRASAAASPHGGDSLRGRAGRHRAGGSAGITASYKGQLT